MVHIKKKILKKKTKHFWIGGHLCFNKPLVVVATCVMHAS